MTRRCPESKLVGLGILRGWKWIINGRRYANVVESPKDLVYGLVYEISPSDEALLDGFETVPLAYTKEVMKIELQSTGGRRKSVAQGLVYVNRERVEEGEPWEEYIHRMNMGIKDAAERGMPEWYIDKYMRRFIPAEEPLRRAPTQAKPRM